MEKVEELRKQILLHSYIYYYLCSSVISDQEYDTLAKELQELEETYKGQGKYAEEFKGFVKGTTSGFDLDYLKPEIIEEAMTYDIPV
jgi:NAD-dependent DNA ligase